MSDVVNEEDNTREIHARISGEFFGVQETESTNDPFVVKAEEIAKYRGFSPNFKRKNTRLLQKFQRGQDGAESKKVETEILMGYDIMDVVTPPYNLDYLAKIYEVSSPHFAACNAKASNIVGLGYEFLETRKTKEKMSEYGDDQKKLAAFRRRLESLKEELQDQLELMNEEDTFTETLTKAFLDREATGNGFLEIGRKVNGQIGFIGHIPATTMRVRKQRDGFVQIVGNRITFFRNFQDTETENPIGDDTRPNEVIHLKKYTPNTAQ